MKSCNIDDLSYYVFDKDNDSRISSAEYRDAAVGILRREMLMHTSLSTTQRGSYFCFSLRTPEDVTRNFLAFRENSMAPGKVEPLTEDDAYSISEAAKEYSALINSDPVTSDLLTRVRAMIALELETSSLRREMQRARVSCEAHRQP